MNRNFYLLLITVILFSIQKGYSQTLLWHKANSGPHLEAGEHIGHDSQGNTYVGGNGYYHHQNVTYHQLVIIKYDSLGNLLWKFIYPDSLVGHTFLLSMVTTPGGYMYAAGWTNDFDWGLLLKLSPGGNIVWTRIDSVTTYSDVKLDDSENLYVGGVKTISEFDSSGNVLWSVPFSSGNGSPQVELDDSLNVLLLYGDNGGFQVRKYDNTGNFKWHVTYESPFSSATYGHLDFECDHLGNVFVCTYHQDNSLGANFSQEAFVSSNGNLDWVHESDYTSEEFYEIAIDENNYAYFVGEGSSDGQNARILKLNSAGDVIFKSDYGGMPDSGATYRSVIYNNGYLYMAGGVYLFHPTADYFIVKADTSGNIIWSNTYGGNLNDADMALAIDADNNGNILVTGQAYESDSSATSMATIKIMDTSFVSSVIPPIRNLGLFKIFPNPASTECVIQFNQTHSSKSIIRVLNLLGQIVLSEEKYFQTGRNEFTLGIASLPTGIYSVEIWSDDQELSARLVVY